MTESLLIFNHPKCRCIKCRNQIENMKCKGMYPSDLSPIPIGDKGN